MLEATSVITTKLSYEECYDSVTLDYEQRCKRRYSITTDKGLVFLLNLSHSMVLSSRDILELSNGELILVKEADDDVLDIETSDKKLLMYLVWYLGNQHRPVEIHESRIRMLYDNVLANDFVELNIPFLRSKGSFAPKSIRGYICIM